MPNIKSAKKRVKTSEKRRIRNKSAASTVATVRKSLYNAVAAGDKAKAVMLFRKYCSVLDKTAKRGIIHSNAANRKKSSAAARLAKLA